MPEVDDYQLLRDFAEHQSDAAFGALVTRYINLVYSAALRQTNNPHAAEEITQAVFIILARKAESLGPNTILSGWLYQTARLTAANWKRTEFRRERREQEAYMQSLANEPQPDVWPQLAPLLDDALGKLGNKDRDAVVLRYFENKSFGQVGAALGTTEEAAKMRVMRAVEKLRKFLTRRGIALSVAALGAAMATNSVQAAPAGLAAGVAASAAKGTTLSASTLALVKGVLKFAAWMKAKTAIAVAAAVVLAAGTTKVVVEKVTAPSIPIHKQQLPDGSVLILNGVRLGATNEFIHGSGFEKMLGNVIPSNGVGLLKLRLARPTHLFINRDAQGRSQLALEFKLVGSNTTNHPIVKPAFYREFRCVLRGEDGIEFAQEFWYRNFQQYADGCFGYVTANRFPRDSKWLWVRVERRTRQEQGGPWTTVAEFKFENPAPSTKLPWVAEPPNVVKRIAGLDVSLGEIAAVSQPYGLRDIWTHSTQIPFQIWSNGVTLTNWGMAYARVEDASGNWDYFASHRGLNPRFVWKLDADFQPQSDFAPEGVLTIGIGKQPFTITTNIMNVPITINWDGSWIDASIATNQANIALKYIGVTDEQGRKDAFSSGSWSQHGFRKGSFAFRNGDAVTMVGGPITATMAIIPNIRATFYAQPKLIKSDKPVE